MAIVTIVVLAMSLLLGNLLEKQKMHWDKFFETILIKLKSLVIVAT